MNRHKYFFFTILYALLLLLTGNLGAVPICHALNRVSDIRYWSAPTFTRVVLDLTSEARYSSFSLDKPDRLVVDLKGFDRHVPRKEIHLQDKIIKKIRVSYKGKGTVRVVIDLAKKSHHKIFPLKKFGKKPPRLVFDITRPDLEKADRNKRETTRKQKKPGDFIVVVDPGHGGEDPGAVSKKGTKEKDIVFSIAKKLVWKLNPKAGIKAYLTRTGDYFIPLQKRIDIADQYGADLFISIHADSSFSPKVAGSSVYCLSFKGASSNTARMAASKENASDFIGGVSLDHYNKDLNTIIFDLVQTHSLNESLTLAGLVLGEISKINKLHTKKPQQANFVVLRSADIPSVLIETDFISNAGREKRMKTQWFQNQFTNKIAAAVVTFLSGEKRSPKRSNASESGPVYHRVRRGETLSGIAQKYNTTTGSLRRLNNMKSKSVLVAGKRLKVMPGRKEPARQKKQEVVYHRVRRGETLSGIAQKYNTTTGSLRRLNSMRSKSVLVAGKRLKVMPGRKEPARQKKQEVVYHRVRRGETLSGIAQKYNTSISSLRRLNSMRSKSVLVAGKRLKVKPGDRKTHTTSEPLYHVVKRGETLSSIALKYRTTVTRLKTLNSLSLKNVLVAGKKLRVL